MHISLKDIFITTFPSENYTDVQGDKVLTDKFFVCSIFDQWIRKAKHNITHVMALEGSDVKTLFLAIKIEQLH